MARSFSVETTGGAIIGLSFKRSVIENVAVDIQQALRAINIINDKAIQASMNVAMSPIAQRAAAALSSTGGLLCPKCGSKLGANATFCSMCGSRV